MKIFPYDRFEAEIPRPPEDVARALKMFAMSGGGGEALRYKPMTGTVKGNSFKILSKAQRSRRLPNFYFCGTIEAHGDGSRVTVRLKMDPIAVWVYAGLGVMAVAMFSYFSIRDPLPPGDAKEVAVIALVGLLVFYMIHMLEFWRAQTRKEDLIKVMSLYGIRAQLDSID